MDWTVYVAAAAALSAGLGLLLASRVLEGREKRRKGFFCYYTNLSNALMLLYHGLLLIPGPWSGFLRRDGVQLAMMLSILVTFLIYFCVLTRFGRHQKRFMNEVGVKVLSNALVHYVTPLLTFLEWLLLAPKDALGWQDTLWWLLLPLAYLLFAVVRASTGRPIGKTNRLWPYDFMDRQKLGGKKWLRNLGLVVLGFWLLGALTVALTKWF